MPALLTRDIDCQRLVSHNFASVILPCGKRSPLVGLLLTELSFYTVQFEVNFGGTVVKIPLPQQLTCH